MGWAVAHDDDISPGGEHVCRERFSEVVLAPRLREAVDVREEIAFFQAVRVSLIKLTRAGGRMSRLEKEAALRQLVAKGVLVDGVNDIYRTLGLDRPDISMLDERFLAQIRELPTRNLAAELLERLIAD